MANKQQQGMGQQNVGQQNIGQQGKEGMGNAMHAGRERDTLGQAAQQASYWREQFSREPYVTKGEKFDEYAPAYRTGYEGRARFAGQRFEDVEDDLKLDYQANRGDSPLTWDRARQACRAAWDRAEQFSASQGDRQQNR